MKLSERAAAKQIRGLFVTRAAASGNGQESSLDYFINDPYGICEQDVLLYTFGASWNLKTGQEIDANTVKVMYLLFDDVFHTIGNHEMEIHHTVDLHFSGGDQCTVTK